MTLEAVKREMHSTVHKIVRRSTNNATGRITPQVSQIVELADGLNYRDEAGNWQPTRAVFEETPAAFVARFGPHKAILARQMGEAVLDLEMPDGVRLAGAPLCLAYFDPVSGKSVILAVAEPSTGQQVSSNQVVYPAVFSSPRASVRYTYEQNRFHQDILLHEAPAAPSRFNLSDRLRLEVMTEWQPHIVEPQKTRRVLSVETNQTLRSVMAEAEFADESLAFGAEMTMGAGGAFTLFNEGELEPASIPIGKRFVRIDGRPIVLEGVEHRAIKPWLDRLPKARASAGGEPSATKTARYAAADRRSLPKASWNQRKEAKARRSESRETVVASTEPSVVLDFVFELNGTKSNWLLANNTNWWITGNVNLNGTTTLEGGTVIKFKKGVGASLNVNGSVVCNTSQYFPAVLTADEDDSIGEFIYPSSPEVTSSGYYATVALNLNSYGTTLQHLRIAYAQEAIRYTGSSYIGSQTLRHLQIVHCQTGIAAYGSGSSYNNFYAGNALLSDVFRAFSGYHYNGTIEHLTIDDCDYLTFNFDYGSLSYLSFRNCLFANLSNFTYNPASFSGSYNGFYNSPQFGSYVFPSTSGNPFQTTGLGGHYLRPDSELRQRGTTAINGALLNDLKQRTTQAPVIFAYPAWLNIDMVFFPQVARYVSGAPDLGFAYDPLDYVVADLAVYQTRLQVSPGTAIGVWPTLRFDAFGSPRFCTGGLFIAGGAEFASQGSPTKLNRIVTADLVQESFNPYAGFITDMWGVNMLAFDSAVDAGPYPTVSCRFTDFALLSDFRRYHSAIGPDDAGFWWNYGDFAKIDLQDCQFRGGRLNLSQWGSHAIGPVRLQNNLFERVTTRLALERPTTLEACNNLFKGGGLTLELVYRFCVR